MGRSGYTDDFGDDDRWQMIRWRGAVASAIRGKRGQAFLKEMLAAMDAMPDKRLIRSELQNVDGEVCAIGAVGKARRVVMDKLDPEEYDEIADAFGLSPALVREIEFINDDDWRNETPERRFDRVREWVVENIAAEPAK